MSLLNNMLLDKYVLETRKISDERFYEERRRLITKTMLVHAIILNIYALTWKKRSYKHFGFTLLGIGSGYLNSFNYTNDMIVEYLAREELNRRNQII